VQNCRTQFGTLSPRGALAYSYVWQGKNDRIEDARMNIGEHPVRDGATGPFFFAGERVDLAADIVRFTRILRQRKSVVIGTMLLITTLVTLFTFQLTPKFTSSTQILIDPRQTQVLDLQSVFAGLSPEASTVESQVHVLRSRSMMRRVARDLNLADDPEFNPSIVEDESSFLSALNPISWLPQSWQKVVAGSDEPKTFLTQEQKIEITEDGVIERVLRGLDVDREGTAFVINISYTSVSPTKAARLANAISELYIVDQLETKFEATRRTTNWLNDRLRLLREELRASEEAVEAFKAEHDLVGSDEGLTLNNQQLAEFHRSLVLARSERAEAEVRLQQIQEIFDSGGGANRVANVITSSLILQLREQDSVLQRDEANLATRYQSRHPKIIEIRNQRASVRAKMKQEVNRVIQELENNVEVARAREEAIEGSLREQQVQTAQQNRLEIQLRELELETEGNRQIYEAFLSRFKATTDQDAIQQSDARIISVATVPRKPSFPDKRLFVAGGFAFSALMGIFLALFIEQLDNGFRSVEQLESNSNIRNIAVVPLLKGRNKSTPPHEYVLDKPLSSYSESIRSIQNSIFLAHTDRPIKYVLTTSALPSEGKTTLSMSLARLMARSGKKTVLVDADLRRPRVREMVDDALHDRGLLDVLEGNCTFEQAIHRDQRSGLSILATKEGGAETPDLLSSTKMENLLAELGEHYEMVIIDAPPILPIGDTKLLSRSVDTVVFAVRWETTPRTASMKALQSLLDIGASVLGTVLTQVDIERYARYGDVDAGHYYGRYSNYYVD
jgi:capsular exopolysaccharide synthesis family protein